MARQALIVVDVQNDFCPGGALAVRRGDEVVKPLNRLMLAFDAAKLPIFMTRDWHPSNHCSFVTSGGPWPPHCIQGTKGAEFHPGLLRPERAMVVSKGSEPDAEAYSAFQGTGLDTQLRKMSVESLLVGGLATDYCVKNTVLDGIDKGFRVTVLKDCIRGVNVKKGDSSKSIKEMKRRGALFVTSSDAIRALVGA